MRNEDALRLRAAALRDRGRHGRCACRRGRGAAWPPPRSRTAGPTSLGEESLEAAHRRGEPPRLGALARRPGDRRDGHDGHGRARRRAGGARSSIGHVGDSRAYRLRGDVARAAVTTDHSLVAELVQSGVLTPGGGRAAPAALRDHARRRDRDRGRGRRVHRAGRARRSLPALLGRAHGMLARRRDRRPRSTAPNGIPQAAGEALVAAANAHGGEDNITVVLFELVDGEPEPMRRRAVGPAGSDRSASRAGSDLAVRPRPSPTPTSARTAPARAAGSRRSRSSRSSWSSESLVLYWGISR